MRLQLDTALTGTGVAGPGEAGQAGSAGTARSDPSRSSGGASGGDSIQISGPSSALNRLSADRSARLEQLSALVQGGTYQVQSAQVSRALVEHAASGGH